MNSLPSPQIFQISETSVQILTGAGIIPSLKEVVMERLLLISTFVTLGGCGVVLTKFANADYIPWPYSSLVLVLLAEGIGLVYILILKTKRLVKELKARETLHPKGGDLK